MNLWMATKVKDEKVEAPEGLEAVWIQALGTKKAASSLPKLKELLVADPKCAGVWEVKRIDIGKGNLETACNLLMRTKFIKSTLEKMTFTVQPDGASGDLVAKKKRGT